MGSRLNPDAIANLTSLRRVTLHGTVFNCDSEQLEFGRMLALKTHTTLEQLTYEGCGRHNDWCSVEFGGLGGLRFIEWCASKQGGISQLLHCRPPCMSLKCIFPFPDNLRPLWPLLSGSLYTCHTLILPLLAFEDDSYQLSCMHFLNLRFLTVHPHHTSRWQAPLIVARTMERLTEFLLFHNTIEELDIRNVPSPYISRFTLDSLPRLSSFKGFASTIKDMASARMKCLSGTLRQLTVIGGFGGLKQMLAHLQIAEGLNANDMPHSHYLSDLRSIQLLTPLEQDIDTKLVIRDCGRLYGPSLEEWRGTLEFSVMEKMSAGEFSELFQSYKKLRTIDLCIHYERPNDYANYGYLLEPDLDDDEFRTMAADYVRELAGCCATIQHVRMHCWGLGSELGHVWVVVRTTEPRPDACGDICPSQECTRHYIYIPNQLPSAFNESGERNRFDKHQI
jgi:hypothetical protein